MRLATLLLGCLLALSPAATRADDTGPLGIGLEGFAYPYPVWFLDLTRDNERQRLAYMDVAPTGAPNGRTVLLLHGRNFPSSYWEPVIGALAGAGYRVVVPDQLGFGKSSKPVGPFSFDVMAAETVSLLDALNLPRVDVVAHSMGGMLFTRFGAFRASRAASMPPMEWATTSTRGSLKESRSASVSAAITSKLNGPTGFDDLPKPSWSGTTTR